MDISKIGEYLQHQDLDIRTRGKQRFSRFMDQKVTPDVLWVIGETIKDLTEIDPGKEFSSTMIWDNKILESRVTGYFQKPSVHNDTVRNEFDKFIGQCLNTLNFSGVIEITDLGGGARPAYFEVRNRDLLEFIAISTHNALYFLQVYIEETLKQSGFWHYVEDFIKYNNKDSYNTLKDSFDLFLKANTNISLSSQYEPGRIFSKVINPIAYAYNVLGSARGTLAKEYNSFTDLIYNEKNWRDLKKRKNISRSEYEQLLQNNNIINNQLPSLISQAMESVRTLHRPKSEVLDDAAVGNANAVHHIFPRHQFSEISYYKENLILLTPEQHLNRAHPNGKTRDIHKGYQGLCLLYKLNSIRLYEKLGYYSKANFIYVLNVGLDLDLKPNLSYDEIESVIKQKYSSI